MTQGVQNVLLAPLPAALLFSASVVAARSLTSTFWLPPPLSGLVLLWPLIFLVLFLFGQWRFLRRAEAEVRAGFAEAALFAGLIAVSVLGLGELFAFLGGRLWEPAAIWHWVVLLACLLGARRAPGRPATGPTVKEGS